VDSVTVLLRECIAHVKEIVATVDHSYTDMQLQHVLEQQCHLDHEFEGPEDGFDGHDHCKDFALKLKNARHEEVETGCEHGYTTFCEDYYIHKGGVIPGASLKEDIEEIEVEAEEVDAEEDEAVVVEVAAVVVVVVDSEGEDAVVVEAEVEGVAEDVVALVVAKVAPKWQSFHIVIQESLSAKASKMHC